MSRTILNLTLTIGVAAFLASCTSDKSGDSGTVGGDTSTGDGGGTDDGGDGDADADGFTTEEGDCDDNDASINPDAEEMCDGVDNNCDGTVDEGVTTTYYADNDEDGFGDAANSTDACDTPSGYTPNMDDCDDADADVYPDAEELCDGVDNDCDGDTDEELDSATWYEDADGDGYGDPDSTDTACEQPEGFTDNDWDCDDSDSGEPVHVTVDGDAVPAGSTGVGTDTGWDTAIDTATAGLGSTSMPFSAIQDGIDAADECVFVWEGTYYEDIDFEGDDMMVLGVDGAENTIISGSGNDPVVTFANSESAASVLSGFTITGGGGAQTETEDSEACGYDDICVTVTSTFMGGGIYVSGASPTLEDLIVTGNELPDYSSTSVTATTTMYVYSFGGGLYVGDGGAPSVTSVWFVENNADIGGGAFVGAASSAGFAWNWFDMNTASAGGGVASEGTSTVENSIFVNNSASGAGSSLGGGAVDVLDGTVNANFVTAAGNTGDGSIYVADGGVADLGNSIFAANSGGFILDGESASGSTLAIEYSDVYNDGPFTYGVFTDMTGTDGNIDSDPSFTAWTDDGDSSDDDFSLASGSLAIDAADSSYSDDDGSVADMGAYGGPLGSW